MTFAKQQINWMAAMMSDSKKNYPEDYDTHGVYYHKCPRCAETFLGGKGRILCKECRNEQ
jgi:hypothetical protein